MKKVLQFILTHWVTLLSGAAAIAAVALCVMGMASDTVSKEMKEAISRSGASSIKGLKNSPQNKATIEREQERGKGFAQEYEKTVNIAKEINTREVLMPGVFPAPKKAAAPFEFKQEYIKTVEVLHKKFDGGTLPSDAEIQEEQQNVEDLQLLEAEQKTELEDDESERTPLARGSRSRSTTRSRSPGRSPAPGASRSRGRSRQPSGGRRSRNSPGRDTSPSRSGGEPKYDAEYRARVEKAKSIRCYYDENTFHKSPIIIDESTPQLEDMWFAQVSLWVQNDVIKAVAELNSEAAERITDGDPGVQHSSVKHLVAVRVHGYEVAPSPAAESGRIVFSCLSPGEAGKAGGASLTGRRSDDQFDVIRFGLSAVVDQRDIPRLIDKITKVNFYQCINVRYQMVDHEESMDNGYFYGTDPVVLASFEFEGYMSREAYQPLMPQSIKKMLGIASE